MTIFSLQKTRKKFAEALSQGPNEVHFATPKPMAASRVGRRPEHSFILNYTGGKHAVWAENGRVNSHLMASGAAVIIPAGCWIEEHWDEPHESIAVTLAANYIQVAYIGKDFNERKFPDPDICYRTREGTDKVLSVLFDSLCMLKPRSRAAISLLRSICEIVEERLDLEIEQQLSDDELLWQRLCERILYCFSYDVSRETMAEMLQIHPARLSKLVRKFAGCGVCDFIRHFRLNYAEGLLMENEVISIEEIARRSGFNSDSYFIWSFRQRHGVSPGHFRRRHLELIN
ncbi:MAG: AraC family transcriptional regulator [Victivallales bacterium]|jgi:AraC-like DNA-binding protein|nr:AraC family transcriptional regulator [Victivallales bacterium]